MSRTKKIAVLAIIAMVLTMLPVQMFAATTQDTTGRLFGEGRVETALAVCDAGWKSADTVIVAAADQANLVDALAAAPLAGQEDAPILLTFKDSLDAAVKAKISDLGASKAYVVGAVSADVTAEIEAIDGVTAEALKGSSRWDTTKAINAKLTSPAGTFVVGYAALADALSVSSYAAAHGYAIVLADVNGNIPAGQSALGDKTYIVGGEALVADIDGADRLAGDDRFATNKDVLETLSFDYNKVYVANGFNNHLVDSLVAAPLAAKAKAAIVLADNNGVGAADYVNGQISGISQIIALGGTGVVADSVRDTVSYDTPATFAVEDVTPVALDVFEVTFNQAVDEDTAENTAAYKVDGSALGAGSKAVLQSDGKTVVVALDTTAISQYQDIVVEVVGQRVYSENKANTAGSFTKEITMSDTAVPTLESVKATGNKKVTVKFSEPVDMTGLSAASWKLDGANLSSVGLTNTTSKDVTTGPKTLGQTVDLYFGTAISAGSHTLKVLDGTNGGVLCDTANFMFKAQTMDFTVETVSGSPSIEGVTCANNTVYVEFDRAMYQDPLGTVAANNANADSALRIGNYDVNSTIGSGTIATAKFKAGSGSKIVELGVNAGNIEIGTNVLEIDKDLKDAWGNKLSSGTNNLRYTFTYEADNVKPTVTSVSAVSTTKVRIQFSEKVNATFATNVSNYKVKDSDGVELFGSVAGGTAAMVAATATTNSDTVELTMPGGTNLRGSNYSLTVEGIRDLAVNPNTMVKYTTTFDGTDDLGPTVSNVYKKDADEAVVRFSEAIDSATVIVDNFGYQAGNGELKNLPTGTTVSLDGTGKLVTVNFPTAYTVANPVPTASDGTGTDDKYEVMGIRVSNVKDTSGNLLQGVAATTVISNVIAADRPAYVNNSFIMYDSGSDVKVEFELNQEVATLDHLEFAVQGRNAAGAATFYTPDSGYTSGKKIILTFSTNAKLVKKAGKDAVLVTWNGTATPGGAQAIGGTLTNTKNAGGIAPAGFAAGGYTVYDDQCKPKVDTITLTDDGAGNAQVAIKFTEDIDATITGTYTDDFIFSSSGTAYSPGAPTTSASGGVMASDVLTYTLTTVASMTEANVFVQAESDSDLIDIRDLKDAKKDRNTYVPSADDKTGVNTSDSMAPVLVSWTMDMASNGAAKNIVLTFNEPVTAANVDLTQISVDQAATGAPQVLTGASKVQTSSNVVTINTLGATIVGGIDTASVIKTSAASDYTLVLGGAAFTDSSVGANTSVAVADFGAPATFAADDVAPKITSITADAASANTFDVVYDDYMVAAADAAASYTLTTGTALALAADATNTADDLTFVLDADAAATLTAGDTLKATNAACTDIAGNNLDTAADNGTAQATVTTFAID